MWDEEKGEIHLREHWTASIVMRIAMQINEFLKAGMEDLLEIDDV
jgi:hypothetical protein